MQKGIEKEMNVLIACEESQTVCKAFRAKGHNAFSCDIQPYEFGHPYSKKTCLWLVNLPSLVPTNIVEPVCNWVSGGSKKADGTSRKNKGTPFRDSKRRSKTFAGIAEAMAEQWGV